LFVTWVYFEPVHSYVHSATPEIVCLYYNHATGNVSGDENL